jgi:hypothetical protein
MRRILLLPITVPLRVAALQLRIARGAAGVACGVAHDLADAAPWSRSPAAEAPVRAAEPPARAPAEETPPAAETPPRPRPRRAARKATAAKPARKRASRPAPAKVAAARAAEGAEEPVASVGPDAGAGPEIHVAPPWEGYDAMALDEVLARLPDADETLLAAVRLYESRGEARQAILLATET